MLTVLVVVVNSRRLALFPQQFRLPPGVAVCAALPTRSRVPIAKSREWDCARLWQPPTHMLWEDERVNKRGHAVGLQVVVTEPSRNSILFPQSLGDSFLLLFCVVTQTILFMCILSLIHI